MPVPALVKAVYLVHYYSVRKAHKAPRNIHLKFLQWKVRIISCIKSRATPLDTKPA